MQQITFKTGREYAEGRRVSMLNRTAEGLAARVTGTEGEKYEVSLKPSVGKIDSSCTCQSWNKFGSHCKHVVAVGLVYLARLRTAADTEVIPGTVPEAVPNPEEGAPEAAEEPADRVLLPALAKLESWIGLSALPDYEFIYRIAPIVQGTSGRQWVFDVRRIDQQAIG